MEQRMRFCLKALRSSSICGAKAWVTADLNSAIVQIKDYRLEITDYEPRITDAVPTLRAHHRRRCGPFCNKRLRISRIAGYRRWTQVVLKCGVYTTTQDVLARS
jgi:hypothetical protein